ncbi:MAG: zinc ribbon domain-containing protein [Eubacteriales bacterium]|nr:zinc ribbon domain-containing protein [Eubacteriales bacterium]
MRICKACGTPLVESEKLCNNCGEEYVEEKAFCPSCKEQVRTGTAFCERCGVPLFEQLSTEPELKKEDVINDINEKMRGQWFKRLPKRTLSICLIAVVLIASAAAFMPRIIEKLKGENPTEHLLYIKNNEIFYSSLRTIEPIEITKRLSGRIAANESRGYFSYLSRISNDGKLLFYPDKLTPGRQGYSLYYKKLDKADENGDEIASEVTNYLFNEDATKLFYTTVDRTLYVYDFSESEKIAEEVRVFRINKEGTKLLYRTVNGGTFISNDKNESVNITENGDFFHCSSDLDRIYYFAEGTFYLWENGVNTVIDTGVEKVLGVYDSKEIYYTKPTSERMKISNLVIDDKLSEDALIFEPAFPNKPVEPVYPDYDNYNSWKEYSEAVEEYNLLYGEYKEKYDKYLIAYDSYQNDNVRYQEKKRRDLLREELNQDTLTIDNSQLYYYNGEHSSLVCDNFVNESRNAFNSPVMVFRKRKSIEDKKIKISEISSINDIYILYDGEEMIDTFIAIKSDIFPYYYKGDLYINENAGRIYNLKTQYNEKSVIPRGNLYETTINNNIPGEKVLYDENVSSIESINENGSLLYYKNIKYERNMTDGSGLDWDYTGDLYMNKEFIDSDVKFGSVKVIPETGSIIYLKEYVSGERKVELKIFSDGESRIISEDVCDYYAISDECITYLKAHDLEDNGGDVYLYNGKDEDELIDSNVTYLIKISEKNLNNVSMFVY